MQVLIARLRQNAEQSPCTASGTAVRRSFVMSLYAIETELVWVVVSFCGVDGWWFLEFVEAAP